MPVTEVAAQSWSTLARTLRWPALFRKVRYITCISGLDSALVMHVLWKMGFNQQLDIEQDAALPSPSLALADMPGIRPPGLQKEREDWLKRCRLALCTELEQMDL